MTKALCTLAGLSSLLGLCSAEINIDVHLAEGMKQQSGRVRLYLDYQNATRPIDNNQDGAETNQVFGLDRFEWDEGDSPVTFDDKVFGYPLPSLKAVPDGKYFVQAELLPYEKFKRKDLPETWMPVSCVSCSGQDGAYDKPDGTLYSDVVEMVVKGGNAKLEVVLTHEQPKGISMGCAGLGDGVDSDYIKTVRIGSKLLSEFWGKEMILEACVLLPQGHSDPENDNARYPLAISHGHYNPIWDAGSGFSEEFPDCDFEHDGYECITQQYAHYFYNNWTATDANLHSPFKGNRMLLATINHQTPFFDDSYAINSENSGPFGDAIVYELIPEIESRFRGIGEGWARGVFGGSTGGWISAAHQVLYPDEFSYALAACPDSVTFTHHTAIEMYNNDNAYFYNSQFKRTPIPGYRDGYSGVTYPGDKTYEDGFITPYGAVISTAVESNHRELVLGENSLSCNQWDAWESSWSPVDKETGFPKRIYDKFTGKIDKEVLEYWKENFDLAHIMVRDWDELGPKLKGKLHFAVGGEYERVRLCAFRQLVAWRWRSKQNAERASEALDIQAVFLFFAWRGVAWRGVAWRSK